MASNSPKQNCLCLKLELAFRGRQLKLDMLIGSRELLICWAGILVLTVGKIPEGMLELMHLFRH